MGRFIGDEGESHFDGLCANAGITANVSTKDRNGWDYYLEFPIDKESSKTLDSRAPSINCKVQVKSSALSETKLQVKVSVLYRLAKDPLPTFFCFFKHSESHIPDEAYLLHVDFQLIDKILKRVRKLESQGKGGKLHDSRLTVHYGDQHKFFIDTGLPLKETIQSYIPNGLDEYIKEKQEHLVKSGFDNQSYEMKVSFVSDDVVDHLIDLELGLKETIPVKHIEAHTTRYGIKLPDDELSTLSEVEFSFPDMKPLKGCLYFKQYKYASPLIFDADIYVPKMFCRYESENLTIRIKSEDVDVVIKRGIPSLIPNINLIDKVSILELHKKTTLFNLLRSGDELLIGFEVDSRAVSLGKIQTSKMEDDIDSKELLNLTNSTLDICRRLNIPEDRIIVDINTLHHYKDSILSAYALLCVHHSDVKLAVSFLPVDNASFPPVAFIFKIKTILGDICISVLGAVLSEGGTPKKEADADKYYLSATDIRIAQHWIGSIEELKEATLSEEEATFVAELENEGFEIVYLTSDGVSE